MFKEENKKQLKLCRNFPGPSAFFFFTPGSNVVIKSFRVANKFIVGPLAEKILIRPSKAGVILLSPIQNT